MSYDLFFRPRDGRFDQDKLRAFFKNRPFYTVESTGARYANEDTGVYFSFEFAGGEDDAVAFSINFYRPSTFILEAEPEVTAFVQAFAPLLEDPQIDGMDEGPYHAERLLSGWRTGNQFAFRAMSGAPPLTMPAERLLAVWRWNKARGRLQFERGEGVLVPRVMFANIEGMARTIAVWPDAIPARLPAVDYLLIPRDQIARRGLFGRKRDQVLLAWADVAPLLTRYARREDGPSLELTYARPPGEIVDAVRAAPPSPMPQVVSADFVLDAELAQAGESA